MHRKIFALVLFSLPILSSCNNQTTSTKTSTDTTRTYSKIDLDSVVQVSEVFSTPNTDSNDRKFKDYIDSVIIAIKKVDSTASSNSTQSLLKSITDSMNKIRATIKRFHQSTSISEFDYLDDQGAKMHAKWSAYRFSGAPGLTNGPNAPQWYIRDMKYKSWSGPFEYLQFLGANGGIWKTRIHTDYHKDANVCNLRFETTRQNGSDAGSVLEIIDWNGNRWDLRIASRLSGPSNIPAFTITRL